jgi:transposase InsO family protein
LTKLGVIVSMSKKGSPWENGSQESFYSNFKLELENPNRFETEGQLIEKICQQIYYYNNVRIKNSIKMPPSQYYALTVKG